MNVDIISDIHIDFYINPSKGTRPKHIDKFIAEVLVPKGSETLIIAGDIGHKNFQMRRLLESLSCIYKDIIVVLGNHDLYIESNNTKNIRKNSLDRLIEIIEICDGIDGVHLLNGKKVTINGKVFAGTIGWYNFSEFEKSGVSEIDIQKSYLSRSSDPHYIRGITSGGMYGDTRLNGRQMFKQEYDKLLEWSDDKIDVMITHVPPWISDENKKLAEFPDDLNYEYFDKPELLKGRKVWVHGHTHYVEDTVVDGCHVVSQPLGYKSEDLKTQIKQITI